MSTTKRKVQSKLASKATSSTPTKVRRRPKGVKGPSPEAVDSTSLAEFFPAETDTSKVERAKKAKVATPKVEKVAKPKPKPEEAYDIKKNGKMSARGLTCLCGCGAPTQTRDARFLSGHDSKMRQAILDGGATPAIVLPFFEAGEVIAGLKLVKGKMVDCKRTSTSEGDESDEGSEEE